MKIVVRNFDLQNAISKVVKAINNKNLNSALEGIKFSAKGDNLTLSATDMELYIEKTVICDTFLEGEVLIPGKFISELVKNIPEDEEVEIFASENKVKISYGVSGTEIQCLPIEEFPIINKDYNENNFKLARKDFKDVIDKIIFSCAQDLARPVYCGCLFEIKEDRIVGVALDGYRMALCKKDLKEVQGNIRCVVPARTLVEISKLLSENLEDDATVYVQQNNLKLDLNGTIIVSRLLDGDFIDYNKLLAKDFQTTFTVNRNALKNCLDRASIIAKEAKNVIYTTCRDNLFTINASSEIGQVNECIAINMQGQEKEIGFNFKNITDVIGVLNDEFMEFRINDSFKPCFIGPVGNNDLIYMILPIRR